VGIDSKKVPEEVQGEKRRTQDKKRRKKGGFAGLVSSKHR